MNFLSITGRSHLIYLLSQCIMNSYRSCHFDAEKKGYFPQEPDFIAYLVRDLAHYIPIILKNKFNITNCTTKGVFCHQSPKVSFYNSKTKKQNCAELGDLLIVYKETNNNKSKSTALLLQAKCVSSTPHKIGSGEQHQLHLYQYWPPFDYSSPVELRNIPKDGTKNQRNVPQILNSEGSHYLLLDVQRANMIPSYLSYTDTTSIPTNPLTYRFPLALAIGKMLHFDLDSGRKFELIPNYDPSKDYIKGDDWSNMINDLIYIGINKHFNRKLMGFKHTRRDFFCFEYNASGQFSGDDIILSANRDDKRDYIQDDEENAGVSTLMINVNITD